MLRSVLFNGCKSYHLPKSDDVIRLKTEVCLDCKDKVRAGGKTLVRKAGIGEAR